MSQEALERYGWSASLAAAWQQKQSIDTLPGRVVADFGNFLKVKTPKEYQATIAKKLRHTLPADQLPKVGDWVVIRPEGADIAVIEDVLPRSSAVVRKANVSRPEQQVLAANVDIAFVVQGLNEDFNLQRLDRYAFQLADSHITPIFVFNKTDLADEYKLEAIKQWGKPVFFTNAQAGEGVEALRELINGKTAVFLGSSGVGKSTITNQLLGEDRQKVGEIRPDDRGRHTTSHRELFLISTGGIIIDTPGIRELQLWGEEGSLEAVFPDIIELAQQCEFRNCKHSPKERGCAVQKALTKGKLSRQRFESYLKLRDELVANTRYSA